MSTPLGRAFRRLQRLQRIGDLGGLVAEHQQALCLALAQKAIERHGLGDLGEAEDSALLGGLDDIGAHPLAVDPRDLGEAGQNRLQSCRAHLDRLLHHIVEPGMLQRREHIGDVGQAILRPGLRARSQAVGPLAAGDLGLPFAVAAVEHQDGVAGGEPQHIAEIVALVRARARPSAPAPKGASTNSRGARKSISGMVMFRFGRF